MTAKVPRPHLYLLQRRAVAGSSPESISESHSRVSAEIFSAVGPLVVGLPIVPDFLATTSTTTTAAAVAGPHTDITDRSLPSTGDAGYGDAKNEQRHVHVQEKAHLPHRRGVKGSPLSLCRAMKKHRKY